MSGEIPAAPPVVAYGGKGSAAVASGSVATTSAAVHALECGGNAVDAALAAGFASAVAEPTLSSLGGGGFLLIREPGEAPVLLDFFVDVPGLGGTQVEPRIETLAVTYGSSAQQVFHVGWGTIATPGCFAGYLDAHRRWGRLPLPLLLAPAIAAAREGVDLDAVQREFIHVIGAILQVTPESRDLYAAPLAGAPFRDPAYADLLAALASGSLSGPADPAYAEPLVAAMAANGGLVTMDDMAAYRPVVRAPISARRGDCTIWTNPPPSFGGAIVLEALGTTAPRQQVAWAALVASLRDATERRRRHDLADGSAHVATGTTHISVIDGEGRVAALSVSNGSGSGVAVNGISFNNMLGEEDLNPAGTGALAPGTRMGSMMAPTLVEGRDGSLLVLGTGGSERIRSALAGVLVRHLDQGEEPATAIAAPRVHAGRDLIDIEPGLEATTVAALRQDLVPLREWSSSDLYFGGVHAVRRAPDGSVEAIGDVRRGGAVAVTSG